MDKVKAGLILGIAILITIIFVTMLRLYNSRVRTYVENGYQQTMVVGSTVHRWQKVPVEE